MDLPIPIYFVVFFIGAMLHFTHPTDFVDHKFKILDVISAVNESTWEHMKIFIVGCLISTLVYLLPSGQFLGFAILASALAVFISALVIPICYYSYKCIIQNNVLFLDIGIFFLASVCFSKLYTFFYFKSFGLATVGTLLLGIFIWLIIIAIVIYWTYYPPKKELFRCPVNDCFGHV